MLMVKDDDATPRVIPTPRARARSLGIAPGILPPGPLNAITDIAGVRVGHVTVIEGDAIRSGATAIAFGWKGGIGSSSRVLPGSLGGATVGVLVQSNF